MKLSEKRPIRTKNQFLVGVMRFQKMFGLYHRLEISGDVTDVVQTKNQFEALAKVYPFLAMDGFPCQICLMFYLILALTRTAVDWSEFFMWWRIPWEKDSR